MYYNGLNIPLERLKITEEAREKALLLHASPKNSAATAEI